jgi:hypothetical protein
MENGEQENGWSTLELVLFGAGMMCVFASTLHARC